MAREYVPKRYDDRNGVSPDMVDDKYHYNGKGGGKYHSQTRSSMDEFQSRLKPIRKKPQEEKTRVMKSFFAREIDLDLIISALDLFGNRLPRVGDNPYDLVVGDISEWNSRYLKVILNSQPMKVIFRTFQANDIVDMFVYKFRKVTLSDHDKFTIMAMRGIAL